MTKKRGFEVPDEMKDLVGGAKVATKPPAETPPPAEQKPPEAEKPPEAPQPPAEEEKTLPAPAPQAGHTHRRADDPAPAAPVDKKPWELTSSAPTGILFKPGATLHEKMEWICNNVPKMSRLRLVREGTELLVDQLIEKHYKP